MEKTKILIIIVAFCLMGTSCSSAPENPPEVTVTINEQEIEYIMQEVSWGNRQSNNVEPLQWILYGNTNIEIPYIDIEGRITVEFMKNPPVEVYLNEYTLYYENGIEISRHVMDETQINLKNKKISFDFSSGNDDELEEDSKSYAIYRGFILTCKWKNNLTTELHNVCVYAFVVRTSK
jgi:hypothetical protein